MSLAGSRLDTAAAGVRWGHTEQDADLQAALGVSADSDQAVHAALQAEVSLAVDAIDGGASCGVTAMVGGRTFTVVHGDARTLLVDAEQHAAGDGPCLHAARIGEVARADSMAAAAQWPVFVDAARRENIHSFIHSFLASPHRCTPGTLRSAR